MSGNGAEQLVEDIGQESFDYPHFALFDGDAGGPVVSDVDGRVEGRRRLRRRLGPPILMRSCELRRRRRSPCHAPTFGASAAGASCSGACRRIARENRKATEPLLPRLGPGAVGMSASGMAMRRQSKHRVGDEALSWPIVVHQQAGSYSEFGGDFPQVCGFGLHK